MRQGQKQFLPISASFFFFFHSPNPLRTPRGGKHILPYETTSSELQLQGTIAMMHQRKKEIDTEEE